MTDCPFRTWVFSSVSPKAKANTWNYCQKQFDLLVCPIMVFPSWLITQFKTQHFSHSVCYDQNVPESSFTSNCVFWNWALNNLSGWESWNLQQKKKEKKLNKSKKVFQLGWGGKDSVLIKTKCDKVQWKHALKINHCDITWRISLMLLLERLKRMADKDIRSVWTDEEIVKFLNESNRNAIFLY